MKNLNQYQHLVWDWNGTLLNDVWLCLKSLNILLEKESLPTIDVFRYQEIFNFPVFDVYKQLGFNITEESFKQLSRHFMDYYESRRLECTLHKGARKFIHEVHNRKITQSILSAYRQDYLSTIITDHDLEKYFIRLSGNDDIYGIDKSYRAPLHLKQLGIPANNILYIGDTLHDIETANAMGVDCVLIDQGKDAHMSRARLEKTGVPIITSYEDLI